MKCFEWGLDFILPFGCTTRWVQSTLPMVWGSGS